MAYIDDDELQRLKQERPMTGNDTIDGYWLGYEAGERAGAEKEKVLTDLYRGWYFEQKAKLEAAEKRAAEIEANVKKLKRKLKGGR